MLNFAGSFVKETEDKSKPDGTDGGGGTGGSQVPSPAPGKSNIYRHMNSHKPQCFYIRSKTKHC